MNYNEHVELAFIVFALSIVKMALGEIIRKRK
jgi:hypothetical protein